ncbi:MAG: nucleotidyltransferase family protein, partial [Candidatus Omnitrophota bacterium]|nr:nucleotidyltransferase family protein [Candidatus Omnitrophota bacterium]
MKNNSVCAKRKNTENLFLAILKMVVLEKESRSFSKKIASSVSAGIDWDYFLLLCLYHRVESLTYLGLKDYFANLPVDLVLKLKGYWLQSESINQNNLAFLKEVLADFRNLGVRVIPLKGLILAQMLYSKSNARGLLCDLDVLVPSSLRLKAEEGLRNKGYEVKGDTEPEGFQWQKDAVRIKDGLYIDLHWNL